MKTSSVTFHWRNGSNQSPDSEGGLHLALGMFDGVHLGHVSVIRSALSSARNSEGISGVFTFDPHPSKVLRPECATKMILSNQMKRERLFGAGVDVIVEKRFDEEFAAQTSEDFLSRMRAELPSLKSIHVGENFRYGSGRSGDVATLKSDALKHEIEVIPIRRELYKDEAISSSRVRNLLSVGDMTSVNDCLGWTYSCRGQVISGKQLGRNIGFPTLNIDWDPECRPRYGVYAVQIHVPPQDGSEQEMVFAGVANYGVRPTVEESQSPKLEIHIPGKVVNIDYGTEVVVEWDAFIREEKKFKSLDLLVEQIQADMLQVAAYYT